MDYTVTRSLCVCIAEMTCLIETVGIRPNVRFNFLRLVNSLNFIERSHLSKLFMEMTWQQGSAHVLSVLHECDVVSPVEYILHVHSRRNENAQLILNDLMEVEFHILEHLFTADTCENSEESALRSILDEAIKRLYRDLISNPRVNNLDFYKRINQGPTHVFAKLLSRHIRILLKQQQSSVREAFANLQFWMAHLPAVEPFLQKLCVQFIGDKRNDTMLFLFKLSEEPTFMEWKVYLWLLIVLAKTSDPSLLAQAKQVIKERFLRLASVPAVWDLLHVLLTARALCWASTAPAKAIDAYADWYRREICEMKFYFNTTEFRTVLKLLNDGLTYEVDPSYLKIHATLSISPPAQCGKLVHEYKNRCKEKRNQILGIEEPKTKEIVDANVKIVIEDSD